MGLVNEIFRKGIVAYQDLRPEPFDYGVVRHGPSLEAAENLDRLGKWQEAGNHYHTLYLAPNGGELRAEGLLGLIQMEINRGRLAAAKVLLQQAPDLVVTIFDPHLEAYYNARISEKRGWIADYQGDFSASLRHFDRTREQIKWMMPESLRGDRENALYSTANHFLGRAYYGLAVNGCNKDIDLEIAQDYFNTDLASKLSKREAGEPDPSGEFFANSWIARCRSQAEDFTGALAYKARAEYSLIELSGRLGRMRMNGYDAHLALLEGEIWLNQGNCQRAEAEFMNALKLRSSTGLYPRGEADAAAGVGLAMLRGGDPIEATGYLFQAMTRDPFNRLTTGVFGA